MMLVFFFYSAQEIYTTFFSGCDLEGLNGY